MGEPLKLNLPRITAHRAESGIEGREACLCRKVKGGTRETSRDPGLSTDGRGGGI